MENLDVQNHLVKSLEEIRELVGSPHEAVVKKSIAMIDEQAKSYIEKSSMMFVASSNERGQCDVSPRGDAPGFVYVANAKQLVIPDRPGNKRVDTLSNILNNPHVGLLFIIPGMEEVLRVNGRAVVIKEHPVLENLKFKDKAPALGIVVDVEECFIHCPRALKHSGIWEHDSWLPKDRRPSSMDIFHAHLKINGYDVK
ncbi:MSMEG_1061 family FMN-dependent PPOX-type flavoprotein [Paenibacillus arenilitoris]|uniref:Pyridoxamine 5'-phosphate oxidase family protein n=1 Tax=Paenibacillus arenilitoris TaxID=2772299 RepID=A0A927CN59_9BACL|nr:MSMEG_1061 family FMN-dependent PPOX-type flavoprotein [Paenibacillus arenilitoris]MBD2870357.1 pyridoxamine 5'-phosphate oxidase family protein [Paenibacillus arenilitoris]